MKEIIKPGYARVTDIIHDNEAFSRIDPAVLENARLRGERLDQLCKAYILGFPGIPESEEDSILFESFKLWAEDKLEHLQVGTRLYDDKLMITGEPDLLWDNKGHMTVVDIKCTHAESVTWRLQGAAYAYLEMQNGLHIDAIAFLRLKRKGKDLNPAGYLYYYEKDFEIFMHFYHRYKFLEKESNSLEEYYKHL